MKADATRKDAEEEKAMGTIVPYTCVFIDAEWKDFIRAGFNCLRVKPDREKIISDIRAFWVNSANQNHVLPCLSVRTGLDLYFSVKAFPAGSEVIMSAINIPDMIRVVEHHNLKVVPVDISIETTSVKLDLLASLITDKTVAILIAHVYGKYCCIDPVIDIARKHNIAVIEDCAEAFSGFENIGNPQADLALFSFGVIKFYTSLGGAIAKVKDKDVYERMMECYEKRTTQKRRDYLKKVIKYFAAYILLNCPNIIKPGMYLTRTFGVDHKKIVVNMLRGFPDQMLTKIKQQPSTSLLLTLRKRLEDFNQSDFNTGQVKGEYVRMRLPEEAQLVGMEADANNYWLFPILVENPDTIVTLLNAMGIDAYRGATQLNMVQPDPTSSLGPITPVDPTYPTEARYLIDHVVYLPVHKNVPFHILNRICKAVSRAIKLSKDAPKVRLLSKL